MGKNRLGIILDGDPQCKQKERVWIGIAETLCKYGWIMSMVLAALFFILGLSMDSRRFSDLGGNFFACTGALGICSVLWRPRVRCAYCKHFFTLKRISGDQFRDSTERAISRKVYDGDSGVVYDFKGNYAFYSGISSHKQYGKEVIKRYTYNVRCSCCGAVSKMETEKVYQHY